MNSGELQMFINDYIQNKNKNKGELKEFKEDIQDLTSTERNKVHDDLTVLKCQLAILNIIPYLTGCQKVDKKKKKKKTKRKIRRTKRKKTKRKKRKTRR
uniref:Uncharacterized protein n=1 Tax=viral metagenome TaxID=1070528 RepID=A0A6C0L2W0_9ZZZZ